MDKALGNDGSSWGIGELRVVPSLELSVRKNKFTTYLCVVMFAGSSHAASADLNRT